jgi:hypothetical protein
MSYSTKEAGALTAYRFSLLFLVFALVALMSLAAPRAQAQDQPPAGSLRGIIPPPPEEGYPTQPVPPPTQSTPKAPDQKGEHSRPPFTVFPPPESPYAVDMAKLGLRVVSAGAVDRISLPAGAKRKPLEPAPGKKLVVVTLLGFASSPIKMPISVLDFSAFWEEVHVGNVYGKKVSDTIIQVARAVALETPKGWLIEGEGLPNAALFYFVDPGPVSLRVGFLLPEGVKRFGIRYPLVADGNAIIAAGTPPVKN